MCVNSTPSPLSPLPQQNKMTLVISDNCVAEHQVITQQLSVWMLFSNL